MGLAIPDPQQTTGTAGQNVPAPPTPPAAEAAAPVSAPGPPSPYELAWTQAIETAESLEIAIAGTSVLVGGPRAIVEARALADGKIVWTSVVKSDARIESCDGVVFLVESGHLHAIDALTGRVRWTVATADVSVGPACQSGTVVVPGGAEMRAYRATDGTEIWRRDVSAAALAPAVIDNATAFVPLSGGVLTAIDLQTGAVKWRTVPGVSLGPLAAANGRVYFGNADGQACAVTQQKGKIDDGGWCYNVRAPIAGAPVADSRFVYFAALDNTIRAFDRHSGDQRRATSLTSRPESGPRLAGKYLLVPLFTSEYALYDVASGKLEARLTPPVTGAPVLQASAASLDGAHLVALMVSTGGTRTLIAFRRPQPKAEGKTPTDRP